MCGTPSRGSPAESILGDSALCADRDQPVQRAGADTLKTVGDDRHDARTADYVHGRFG
jgi:hypothetical protein